MRFIVGTGAAGQGVYLVEGTQAWSLTALDSKVGPDLRAIIDGHVDVNALAERKTSVPAEPVAGLTPGLPIALPGKIICLGLNYVDHIKEGGYDIPDYPALFIRTNSSMIPAGAPMVRPTCSEQLDYEAELMVIIGKGGKHISEADALSHVFGYTLFNDGSVREYQRKTHQWTPGKNFDATGPVGPVIVTPDELPEGANGLKIESRVGQEILQSATTSDMLWSVARTIATVSEFTTLEPGDYLAMGTPPGVGHAKKPPRWLRPGETVEVEIEGIGICANPIIAEEDMSATEAAE
ncbi:FAA hydrolase family protein [Roseibium denhamense]|uniref:2-keto-4-pentenoate hydratase/2-oxohepta-3-ene-1,7-dioic acid hydratase (Catechol pathway) n=1 Tax=Roseibium denhamense TaxID=76305 RepID=A0ABY1NGY3_9HYPH|nr:fumarylacetoacetate hydrolase family protein [Roseibium denhamense]MTI06437.1 FAA hydrolase family protein [Roseibium denhamense]SMP09081.1 2-keto-4-pentenoate hydratase/2-oxohepta-3-ene-1,7-dioic acid hydratase (catechol pathway) [Roseibium denhamense]